MLDRLPLGPTGKVDRRALPAPTAAGAGGAFVAPRGPLEEALAELWTEVLGRPVGAFDDFFKVGGHSLAATRVITRVRRDFAIQVPVRALFESPRLADFAAALVALEVETENGTD
ncbi:phosphopantetheine-binding protein [Actinoplanes sp. ATCC 53533]|uniref:phosphopantetheine-binding protein n=1 Tax=Actinoplanes sp. ATCC 53533 TaxID=1288362 RepID=UPI00272D4383|nr:phosphopantetheine-binding protein [Actinoplanes sp. ATCC 53533]